MPSSGWPRFSPPGSRSTWGCRGGSSLHRNGGRTGVRGDHRGARDAPRRLLLRAPDAGPERALPGLLRDLQGVRLGVRRALRRVDLHQLGLGAADPVPGVVLRRLRPPHRRAHPVPLHRREAARPPAEDGAGEARGIRRGDRRRLQAGADHRVPHLFRRAGFHRRLLHRPLPGRRVLDLQLRYRAARPRHAHHRRHRKGRGGGGGHPHRGVSRQGAHHPGADTTHHDRHPDALRGALPAQRALRHEAAVPGVARQEERESGVPAAPRRAARRCRRRPPRSATRTTSITGASTRCSETI